MAVALGLVGQGLGRVDLGFELAQEAGGWIVDAGIELDAIDGQQPTQILDDLGGDGRRSDAVLEIGQGERLVLVGPGQQPAQLFR